MKIKNFFIMNLFCTFLTSHSYYQERKSDKVPEMILKIKDFLKEESTDTSYVIPTANRQHDILQGIDMIIEYIEQHTLSTQNKQKLRRNNILEHLQEMKIAIQTASLDFQCRRILFQQKIDHLSVKKLFEKIGTAISILNEDGLVDLMNVILDKNSFKQNFFQYVGHFSTESMAHNILFMANLVVCDMHSLAFFSKEEFVYDLEKCKRFFLWVCYEVVNRMQGHHILNTLYPSTKDNILTHLYLRNIYDNTFDFPHWVNAELGSIEALDDNKTHRKIRLLRKLAFRITPVGVWSFK